MQSSSASLLGLPPELRLSIYEQVFHQLLGIRPLDGFKLVRHYPPRPNGLSGSFVKVKDIRTQPTCFSIPWVNLMQSCKTLSQEIKQYMETSSYSNTDENRTFEMDLKPANSGEVGSLVVAVWRRIPCPLRDAQRLILHVDGSAKAILPAINLFLHCGICMDRDNPLERHLAINELVVNIISPRALAVPDQITGLAPVNEQALSGPEFEVASETLANFQKQEGLLDFLKKHASTGRHSTTSSM